jgi:hypothetical protein
MVTIRKVNAARLDGATKGDRQRGAKDGPAKSDNDKSSDTQREAPRGPSR